MPLVLKWQVNRQFCEPQVLSIYQDFACIRNLNMLEFHRVC